MMSPFKYGWVVRRRNGESFAALKELTYIITFIRSKVSRFHHKSLIFEALQTATGVSPASSGGSVDTDPILLEILRRTLMEIPGTLTARNRLFKMNLIFGYDCADGSNSTYCMLLGISLPNSVVIAAHLFRRSLDYLARSLMDFDDIDNARNGLLLFAPIEKAYDNFDISFIWSSESSSFKIKVFNSAMLQRLLIDDLTFEQLDALGVNLALTQQNRNAGQAVRPTYAP